MSTTEINIIEASHLNYETQSDSDIQNQCNMAIINQTNDNSVPPTKSLMKPLFRSYYTYSKSKLDKDKLVNLLSINNTREVDIRTDEIYNKPCTTEVMVEPLDPNELSIIVPDFVSTDDDTKVRTRTVTKSKSRSKMPTIEKKSSTEDLDEDISDMKFDNSIQSAMHKSERKSFRGNHSRHSHKRLDVNLNSAIPSKKNQIIKYNSTDFKCQHQHTSNGSQNVPSWVNQLVLDPKKNLKNKPILSSRPFKSYNNLEKIGCALIQTATYQNDWLHLCDKLNRGCNFNKSLLDIGNNYKNQSNNCNHRCSPNKSKSATDLFNYNNPNRPQYNDMCDSPESFLYYKKSWDVNDRLNASSSSSSSSKSKCHKSKFKNNHNFSQNHLSSNHGRKSQNRMHQYGPIRNLSANNGYCESSDDCGCESYDYSPCPDHCDNHAERCCSPCVQICCQPCCDPGNPDKGQCVCVSCQPADCCCGESGSSGESSGSYNTRYCSENSSSSDSGNCPCACRCPQFIRPAPYCLNTTYRMNYYQKCIPRFRRYQECDNLRLPLC